MSHDLSYVPVESITHDMFGFQYCFCVIFVCSYFICMFWSSSVCFPLRLPNAFALNSTHSVAAAGSASEDASSPVETDTLKIEEVQAPATGTRKAKVLYDYDAADSSELSLLADEVRFHHQPAAHGINEVMWHLLIQVMHLPFSLKVHVLLSKCIRLFWWWRSRALLEMAHLCCKNFV